MAYVGTLRINGKIFAHIPGNLRGTTYHLLLAERELTRSKHLPNRLAAVGQPSLDERLEAGKPVIVVAGVSTSKSLRTFARLPDAESYRGE